MTTITLNLSDQTIAAVRKFAAHNGMSVEGYLITVARAITRAASNPLHSRVVALVNQGLTDADIAETIGSGQTSTSIAGIRRSYDLPANRRYPKRVR